MTETKPYASSLKTKAIAIFSVDDESKPYANITNLVTHFYHIEDIMSPAYEGRLVIVDTGASIISSMPIQGNEKVTIEVEDTFNTTYTYEYRVWTVANRQSADRKQVYTLGLISPEGLQNESVKVAQGVEQGKDWKGKKRGGGCMCGEWHSAFLRRRIIK